MHFPKKISQIMLVGSVAIFAAPPVFANDDLAEMQLISKAAGLITLEDASSRALAAKPGTIVDADLDDRNWPNKGWDYEFEIIDAAGVEWEVDIDAKTGEVRRVSKDWF